MQVRLSPLAEDDLEALYLYVQANVSPHGATWFNRLQDTIQVLAANPFLGKEIPRRKGVFRLTYGKRHNVYLIVYRVDLARDTVQVLRVLHGRTRTVAKLIQRPL